MESPPLDSAGLCRLPRIVYGQPKYNGKPVLAVVKATNTSIINYMKVLMLAEELELDYEVAVVNTKDDWYGAVHPERYVPTILDEDAMTGEVIYVFESTSCLQYLAEIYDTSGLLRGRTQQEKAEVTNWLAYQTAGLGATSKYWLYFSRIHPKKEPETVSKLYDNCIKQWNILEKRLSEPGRKYIALKDRPTIADLAYYPFAMPWMFNFYELDIADWPHIKKWAERMEDRPAIRKVLQWAPTIGHEPRGPA